MMSIAIKINDHVYDTNCGGFLKKVSAFFTNVGSLRGLTISNISKVSAYSNISKVSAYSK